MPGDPALEALWNQVVDHWDELTPHRAFLDHSQRSNQLVEAARRYRSAANDPGRAATADAQLKAISALALAKLESARTPTKSANRRAAALIAAVLVLTALAAVLFHLGTTIR